MANPLIEAFSLGPEAFADAWYELPYNERCKQFERLIMGQKSPPPAEVLEWLIPYFRSQGGNIRWVWRLWTSGAAAERVDGELHRRIRMTTLLACVNWNNSWADIENVTPEGIDLPHPDIRYKPKGATKHTLELRYYYRREGGVKCAIEHIWVATSVYAAVALIRPPPEMLESGFVTPLQYHMTLVNETDRRDVICSRMREWYAAGEKIYICGNDIDVPRAPATRTGRTISDMLGDALIDVSDSAGWRDLVVEFLKLSNTIFCLTARQVEYLWADDDVFCRGTLGDTRFEHDAEELERQYPLVSLELFGRLDELYVTNSMTLETVHRCAAAAVKISASWLDEAHALALSEHGQVWQMPFGSWCRRDKEMVLRRTIERRIALLSAIRDGLLRCGAAASVAIERFCAIAACLPYDLLVVIALRWVDDRRDTWDKISDEATRWMIG